MCSHGAAFAGRQVRRMAKVREKPSLGDDLRTLADLYATVLWWMASQMRERSRWPWLSPQARTHQVAPTSRDYPIDPLLLDDEQRITYGLTHGSRR